MTVASRFRRIVVPLDSSQIAEEGVPFAEEVAKHIALPLTLVRVVDDAELPGLQ